MRHKPPAKKVTSLPSRVEIEMKSSRVSNSLVFESNLQNPDRRVLLTRESQNRPGSTLITTTQVTDTVWFVTSIA